MASTSLSALAPLAIQSIDNNGIKTLKAKYNDALTTAKKQIDVTNPASINAQANSLQGQITQFNNLLTIINDCAASLNILQPQEQVAGSSTISTIDLTLTGTVILA